VSRFDEFVLIDDLRSQRLNSLFDLPQSQKFSLVQDDVRTTNLEQVLESAEAVVHLAALTDAESSALRPQETLDNNLGSTVKLIKACVATDTRLVFPSTTSVYGAQDGVVSEVLVDSELNPQSPYAESKVLEERAIQELAEKGRLEATVFRFGTIFGTSPGMRFHTAVNKFCWQARFGTPLTVWRTAMNQLRPYLAIEDSVHAIDLALSDPGSFGGITNVVTDNFSVKDVVSAIQIFVPSLEVQLVDSPIMNQLSYNVSNKKSMECGITYAGNLEAGVEQTLGMLGVVSAQQAK
jgi:nucleoside-diphosphate-sugar epimerase